MNEHSVQRDDQVRYSIGCWGCATSIAALILIVYMLTHLTPIFAKLNQFVK